MAHFGRFFNSLRKTVGCYVACEVWSGRRLKYAAFDMSLVKICVEGSILFKKNTVCQKSNKNGIETNARLLHVAYNTVVMHCNGQKVQCLNFYLVYCMSRSEQYKCSKLSSIVGGGRAYSKMEQKRDQNCHTLH